MSHYHKRLVSLLALVALAALPLLASGCTVPAQAASPQQAAPQRNVTVSGRGMVSAKPDLAMASLGVETFGQTVGEAVKQNGDKMAAVMAKLGELGIADKDIQTSNFNINFERQGSDPNVGQYRVSNMVQIKIRDLDKAGSILDAAVQAGVNQVWGVNFTIEDQAALEGQARVKAVEDARKRADALAKLGKVQLGQVLAVSEGGAVVPLPAARFGMGGGGGASADVAVVSVSPGEVQVTYQVQVTYAIQ